MLKTIEKIVGCHGLAVMLLLAGCVSTMPQTAPHRDVAVAELAEMMTGWFDSADQAAADPENFFDIRLVMLPIWPARTDGRWLYVEQAAASALDKPYRQRVYHIHRTVTGELVSDVYAFEAEPLRFAGVWQREGGLEAIDPAELTPRDGCSITLKPGGPGRYTGTTAGQGCTSTLRGAAYATSEVEIEPHRLTSWDRGWTEAGQQAWGASEGAYVFVKRGDGSPPITPE